MYNYNMYHRDVTKWGSAAIDYASTCCTDSKVLLPPDTQH